MSEVFIKIFNLGLTAGWLVLAILLCRPLMRRVPKWINCLLWGIVGLRLVFPFSLESIFSLIPSAEPLPPDIMMSPLPEINSGVGVLNNAVNPIISTTLAPEVGASVNPMQVIIGIAAWIWVIGIALMLGYGAVSYISLRFKVRASVKGEKNVCFCDEVDSPFILGVIRPRIYVPSGMCGEELDHVLAHERAHLRRCDHLWKPLGFTFLAFYWFNPILWAAYALLCRDIESACDEKVIKTMSAEAKKSYSEALLACSLHRKRIMACPLAFGEVGVKQRIKSVLSYKKPAFWVIIAALIATLVLSVCFLTNPQSNVRVLLEPGSKWECNEDISLSVTVENMVRMKGVLKVDDQIYEIVIRDRNDGRKVRAYILKAEIEDIKYDSNGDLVSSIEYNEWRDRLEAEHLLFSGILTARGDDVVLKIDQDNIGIGSKRLILERTNDSSSNYPQTVQNANGNYIRITDSGSDQKELDASLIWAKRDGNDIVFWLKWKNKSLKNRSIGESFKIYRYEGENKPVPLEGFGYWREIAIRVSKSVTYMNYNITEHYDISAPGKYRFESYGAWVEFEVVREDKEETSSQNEVNDAHNVVFDPSYKFSDPSRKYDVYVWQMAQNSFSFALLDSKPRDWLDDELFNIKGVRAAEMRQILLEKNLGPDDVNIVPWQNPLSSYIGDYWMRWTAMDDVTPQENMYFAMIYDMLFGTSSRKYYPTVYESEHFDIDGDGEREINNVALGLDDGKFVFSYIVSEDGRTASYYDTFDSAPMSLKFFTSDGKVRLRGVDEDGGVHIYDIALEGGHVKLTEIEDAPSVVDLSQNKLDLSKADFSLVDRIVITNGQTGEVEYLSTLFNKDLFRSVMDALKNVTASDPVSNKGHYGFNYHVELYYGYQTVFSFSLCNEPTDAPRIVCGYYETDSGFEYPARYKLTNPSYEKLAELLGKFFK